MNDWDWMDWRDLLWLAIVLTVICNIAVAIGPGYEATWTWLGSNASNLSGWVQAIGSIAVIAAGFRVARFQLDRQAEDAALRERESQRQTKMKQLFLLKAKFDATYSWAVGIVQVIEAEDPGWAAQMPIVEDLLDSYSIFTPQDYPSPVAPAVVAAVTTALRTHIVMMATLSETTHYTPQARATITKMNMGLQKIANRARAWAAGHLDSITTAEERRAFDEERDSVSDMGAYG